MPVWNITNVCGYLSDSVVVICANDDLYVQYICACCSCCVQENMANV